MAEEIERKFLLASDEWLGLAREKQGIRQFYLMAAEDRSLRVRIRGDGALLTVKLGKQARLRHEYEYPLPLEDARRMEDFAVGRVIEKTRHLVPHKGYTWEVDVFTGPLAGLVVAELETADDVADDDLPPWIGREVTGVAAYYNASLATNGLPETHG